MKPDGSGERLLTSGYHNEGPTFAPNGRVLMFFRDPGGSGGPSLYTVDVTGRNEQKIPTPALRVRSGLVAAAVVMRVRESRPPMTCALGNSNCRFPAAFTTH